MSISPLPMTEHHHKCTLSARPGVPVSIVAREGMGKGAAAWSRKYHACQFISPILTKGWRGSNLDY